MVDKYFNVVCNIRENLLAAGAFPCGDAADDGDAFTGDGFSCGCGFAAGFALPCCPFIATRRVKKESRTRSTKMPSKVIMLQKTSTY
jgi:hypothetical protein